MTSMINAGRLQPETAYVAAQGDEEPLGPSPLQKIWRIIWLNRFAVAGIVVVCLILALVATLLATPEYTAKARLQVNRIEAKVSDVEGVQPTGDYLQYEEFYNTQYALLASTSLAERVARALNLASNEEFLDSVGLLGDDEFAEAPPDEAVRKIGEILLENVAISPVRGSSLIDVQFTSPSPQLSARIARAWVDQFISASLERRFATTNDAREFLQRQLTQLRERLEDLSGSS